MNFLAGAEAKAIGLWELWLGRLGPRAFRGWDYVIKDLGVGVRMRVSGLRVQSLGI